MTGPGEKLTVAWGVAVAVKQVAIAGNIAVEQVALASSSSHGKSDVIFRTWKLTSSEL